MYEMVKKKKKHISLTITGTSISGISIFVYNKAFKYLINRHLQKQCKFVKFLSKN
jgi:hypothetical protein